MDQLIEKFNSNHDSKAQAIHFIASHAVTEAHKDSQLYKIFEKDFKAYDGKPSSVYLKFCKKDIYQIRGADFMR